MRNWMLLLLIVTSTTMGCSGGADGDATGLNEGTLEVRASTTGSDPDLDGYTLSVDNGTPHPLPANGADTVTSLSPGTHTVTLAGVAPNCLLGGENPRGVEITAATTTSLRVDVACNASSAIWVSAATIGEELDPDGFRVAVDGGEPQPLAINGSVRLDGLTSGEHDVALSDVAGNCGVSGANPVRVAVQAGLTANADFSVTCSPAPLAAPGHDIAIGWTREVYLLSADGATFANLTNNPANDIYPAWSPDGQRIAFYSARTGTGHIWVMNADGSGQTQLTTGDDTFNADPAWSPDGSKIAYQSNGSTGDSEIFVMNPDGSGRTQLTNTGFASNPQWSPDGTRITFTAKGPTEFDVFVMNADGSEVTRLTTDPATDGAGAWSPDGTKIAFNSNRSGTYQIYVMNPDGTGVTQLTFGAQGNGGPAWSPDGSKIAFLSDVTGNSRLYMMNPDGTGQEPLTPDLENTWVQGAAWRP